MSFLPDELKTQTFPCPNCQQYISSEIGKCKFCSAEITSDIRQNAIAKETDEKKAIYLKNQKNMLVFGIAFLAIGLVAFLYPIISVRWMGTSFSCLSPPLVVFGLGVIIYSLLGYYKEKRKI